MDKFDPIAIEARLKTLTRYAQLAFGLSCCERLFPNYLAFKRESGWGEPSVLRRGLDLAWGVLDGIEAESGVVKRLAQEVRQAEPETEDFDMILVSSALDAAASIGLMLSFLEGGGVREIVEVASLCRDTVDMFVQDLDGLVPHDPMLEDKILHHRLMQNELRRQEEDLLAVENFNGSKPEVASLKERWREPRVSNIEQCG